MTIIAFIAKLEKLKTDLAPGGEVYNDLSRAVSLGALALVKERIHEQGLAVDGNDIGQYNKTNPIYVNPANSPVSFQPLGKNAQYTIKEARFNDFDGVHIEYKKRLKPGQRKLANGNQRETKYFESYDAFKTYIGRNELGKVNLFLTGGLQNQFTVLGTNTGWGLGWPGTEYYLRAKALEEKYGKVIWALTGAEKEKAYEAAQAEVNEYLYALH